MPKPEVETMDAVGEPRLIGAKDVAALLAISQRTLWRLLSAGKLIRPLRLGGVVRWRIDEIKDWIANGCPAPIAPSSRR